MKNSTIICGVIELAFVAMGFTSCWQQSSAVDGQSQGLFSSQKVVEAMEVPLAKGDMRILKREGYTLSYNDVYKIPNWVAWELTAKEVDGRTKRTNEFIEDTDLPIKVRSQFGDYKDPRYDRGHMAPAGDMKWSQKAMNESFLMSNMCPQASHLNRGCWRILEESCRNWAQKYGEIYIVCGPIVSEEGTLQRIGRNKVVVPDSFFKVVLYKNAGDYYAVGFVFPNDDCNDSMRSYATSVNEVERLTNIDFFHQLSDDVEERVEATYDLSKLRFNTK